jgi:hypothetical protein
LFAKNESGRRIRARIKAEESVTSLALRPVRNEQAHRLSQAATDLNSSVRKGLRYHAFTRRGCAHALPSQGGDRFTSAQGSHLFAKNESGQRIGTRIKAEEIVTALISCPKNKPMQR